MLTSNNLLKVAKSDLKASRELIENSFFPQAIFLFQQSLEKTIKSFAISSGYFTKQEVKDYGHDIIRVYKNLNKNQIQNNNLDIFEKIPQFKKTNIYKYIKNKDIGIDEIKDSQKELRSYLSWVHNEQEEIVNITKKDIKYLIDKIYEMKEFTINIKQILNEKNMDEIMKEIKSILFEMEKSIKEFASSNNRDIKKDESIVNEVEKNLQKEDLEEIIRIQMELLYITQTLFFFACIFPAKHATLTRYPTENHVPNDLYDEDYTLICYYKDLYDILNHVISRLINLESYEE